jgi:transitional endoplasmic reticulum ATPase
MIWSVRSVPHPRQPTSQVIEIIAEGEALRQTAAVSPAADAVEVGGLGHLLAKVREVVVMPLRYPEMFQRLGIAPPRGVLMYGPPGCGKTLIARSLAAEVGANFHTVNGPELVGGALGQSEENLRKVFEKAVQHPPSVIFFDEIDAIAGRREDSSSGTERRLVTQLLTLMDGVRDRGRVVVLAATNRPDDLDPAIRRPGRFDREVEVPVPDEAGRLEILRIHCRRMALAPDVRLEEMAAGTHGFVGADLAGLCREAGLRALREAFPGGRNTDPSAVQGLSVHHRHFEEARKEIRPSSLRQTAVEIPKITWNDVGGLDEVKRELHEALVMPLKEPDLFRRMGLHPPKGVLLAGPPGTGKTLIARATAAECHVNFICVNGPSLVSKYVGESERAVREVFAQARRASPCVIFFDEFDAIAPMRGGDGGESGHANRLVAQLLVEIDGFEPSAGVFCLAATNRPEAIDPALLRPGRFDKVIEIPLPDEATRRKILEVHTRGKPLERNCHLDRVLPMTEGMSGAQIEEACRRAALAAVRKALRDGSRIEPAVSERDLMDACREVLPPEARPQIAHPRPRALVLEDEAAVRAVIARALELGGFDVAEFGTAEDALRAIEREHFDLTTLDINLPGMNGLEALSRIRDVLPNLPVIMVTAQQDAATAIHSFRLGAVDYIMKPFKAADLVRAAQKAIQEASAE